MKLEWQPCVPGTDVQRIELLQLMQRAAHYAHNFDIIEPDTFEALVSGGVLTVMQLSQIFDIGRQAIYVRLLRAGVPLPEHTCAGRLHIEYLETMIVAVKALAMGKGLPEPIVPNVYLAASPKLLEHLTGIPLRGKI